MTKQQEMLEQTLKAVVAGFKVNVEVTDLEALLVLRLVYLDLYQEYGGSQNTNELDRMALKLR